MKSIADYVVYIVIGMLILSFVFIKFGKFNLAAITLLIGLVIIILFFLIAAIFFTYLIRNIDIDYFRNVIAGIVGGFVILIFSRLNSANSWQEFLGLLPVNLSLILIAMIIILVGFLLCRKTSIIKSKSKKQGEVRE